MWCPACGVVSMMDGVNNLTLSTPSFAESSAARSKRC